jgi:type IV pilus assembly protein PilO
VTIDLRPWRRLFAVWLPAVLLCVVSGVVFVWQTSESGGRRSQVRNQIDQLEQEIARLERLQSAAVSDRETVAQIDRQFDILFEETFGSLDQRLTSVLRAVGSATREAGLLPGSYSYSAADNRETGFIRFGVRFSVDGEYGQIRRMLAALQSSPEFLVVETLNLRGAEDPVSRDLKISVNIATFLAEADEGQLSRLTGNVTNTAETTDG